MKNRLTRGVRACIVFLSVVAGVCVISAEAQADWGADFIWYPTSDPSAVGTCIAGEPTTFEGKETGDPPLGTRTQYIWKFAGCTMNDTCPHGSGAQTTTWTLPEVNPNNKVILQIKNGDDSRPVFKTVPVTGNAFTVNVLPSAGCTVLAGDGGVDDDDDTDPDGNGIACSGGMNDDDPRCTEQFKNNAIASLKVVTSENYAFTGWTVNGAQLQAAASTLFLTTMPRLAQNSEWFTPFTGNIAECQANCSKVTISAPATVKRDEIFDVTLTLDPPPLWEETKVTFDLDGQKTQDLPGRGTVQMYDFGYDIDGDGDIDPGQTSYVFKPLLDGGTKTITAVYNLSETPPYAEPVIKIAAKFGKYTFESPPIAVTYQIRQYTTDDSNPKVNKFDQQITTSLEYWQSNPWQTPTDTNQYQFKETDLDADLIKAICYKESTMKNNNLMQVKQEGLDGLKQDKDWDWSVQSDGVHPIKNWTMYPMHAKRLMNYTEVAALNPKTISDSESLRWGIRYLYAKRSKSKYDFWYIDKENGIECTLCTGTNDPPDCCTGKLYDPVWYGKEQALQRYNSTGDANNATYASSILTLYANGKTPHAESNIQYLWPIMTNFSARQD